MPNDGLHKHALWFFGVILGLAIKEGLVDVFPHIFRTAVVEQWVMYVEVIRLAMFLLISIRFYLGAVVFFERAYGDPATKINYKKKNFGVDFLFGFVHFLFFSGMALSIDIQENFKHWFPLLMAGALAYDVLWYIFSRRYDTRYLIRLWTVVNLVTLLFAIPTYLIVRRVTDNPVSAETFAYIPVAFFSFVDIGEITTGNEIVSTALVRAGEKIKSFAVKQP
jgi:hypothetical protein